jgi:hypothetical protein
VGGEESDGDEQAYTDKAHGRIHGGRYTIDVLQETALQGVSHILGIDHHFSSEQTKANQKQTKSSNNMRFF